MQILGLQAKERFGAVALGLMREGHAWASQKSQCYCYDFLHLETKCSLVSEMDRTPPRLNTGEQRNLNQAQSRRIQTSEENGGARLKVAAPRYTSCVTKDSPRCCWPGDG